VSAEAWLEQYFFLSIYVANQNAPVFYVSRVRELLGIDIAPEALLRILKRFLGLSKSKLIKGEPRALQSPEDRHARHHASAPRIYTRNVYCEWMHVEPGTETALDHEEQLVGDVRRQCAGMSTTHDYITLRVMVLQAPKAPPPKPTRMAADKFIPEVQDLPYFTLTDTNPSATVRMLAEALAGAESQSTVTSSTPASSTGVVTVCIDANVLPRGTNGTKVVVADRKRRLQYLFGSFARVPGVGSIEVVVADGATSVAVLGCFRTPVEVDGGASETYLAPTVMCDLLQIQTSDLSHIQKLLRIDKWRDVNLDGVPCQYAIDNVFHPTIAADHHYPFGVVFLVDRVFNPDGKRALDHTGAPVCRPVTFNFVFSPNLSGFLKTHSRAIEAHVAGDRVGIVEKLKQRVTWQRRNGSACAAQAVADQKGCRVGVKAHKKPKQSGGAALLK
jgi:hypothetical protein